MNRKYLNEAIIGNNEIVASFSKKGEMLRLFYPTKDYKQFVDCMYTGVKVNDSAIIYLHDDINNVYSQYYTENTNILNTKIKNTYFNLSILQTDFAAISQNILVKKLVLTNENTIDLNVNFIVYSKLLSDFNNMVGSKIENDILMQYSHDFTYCIFSKAPIQGHRLNNSKEEIKSGILKDKDYIGMSNDSAISFEIGNLKAGESKEFEIIIYINNNLEQYQFDEIISDVEKIRKIDINKELEKVEKYWQNYVKKHDGLKVIEQKEKWQKLITGQENLNETTYKKYEQMKNVYIRSILLFPLLTNAKTGGISAAIEIDEEREKSGRYSYCWPRDAVFVTKALDILNMKEETTKFYLEFCKKTQSQNGMWEQRFYTDGRLAPCWGYQIDETASIIYGIYEHYKETQNKEFLKQVYPMCQKAIDALGTFLNVSSVPFTSQKNKENMKNFLTHESYDLWEMHEGVHLYSMAAMYAAYEAMLEIEKVLEKKEYVQEMELMAEKLKEYCKKNLYNEEEKTLKRSNKDNICDISILGTVTPFNMFKPNEKEVINTVEKMNMTLRTYTGGYIRFENDNYMGGNNPWPVATLWMAQYNLKIGKAKEAMEQIEFVIKTATKHGFLAEQINNETMQANWVIGLGWSHAMFILALSQLGTVPNCEKVAIGDRVI
jgi:glycoside hydrolase 15-related